MLATAACEWEVLALPRTSLTFHSTFGGRPTPNARPAESSIVQSIRNVEEKDHSSDDNRLCRRSDLEDRIPTNHLANEIVRPAAPPGFFVATRFSLAPWCAAMADNNETGGDAQITFKVKSSNDKTHTITMDESATVLDLKNKLAGADFEDIPADRQRLIYSGRIMKDSDALSVYKIKHMNTIHLVKSARSNAQPAAGSSSSTPTPAAVPQNMAAGSVAGDPLAGLTGARFAGHANLPSADLFGADGGVSRPSPRLSSDPVLLTPRSSDRRWVHRQARTSWPICCPIR